jgi:hypothetical protein
MNEEELAKSSARQLMWALNSKSSGSISASSLKNPATVG